MEEQRSRDRYRRVVLTALTSVLARGISVLTVLISVPLTVDYLGLERFGLWMTISSIIAMLGFADLGISNGLMNTIADANGKEDHNAARKYVSSAFFMVIGIAAATLGVFTVAFRYIPWGWLFNVHSEVAIGEAGPAMAVFVGCFALGMPFGLVQRVQMGYQEGYINELWVGVGSVLGLLGVLLAIYFEGSLPWLVLAMAGAPVFANMLNSAVLFKYKRPWIRPEWRCVTGETAQRVFLLGIQFCVLQIVVSVAFLSDNVIAARVFGPESVAQYAVPMRMFSIVAMALGFLLNPLWPAYGESIARGDVEWVKRTLVRSLVMSLLFAGVTSSLLLVFGVRLVQLWAGQEISPSFLLLLGFAVWTVISVAGNAVAVFLNGTGALRLQIICALPMISCALGLKVFLAYKIGLPGIIWGTIIAYAVCTAIPVAIIVPKLLAGPERCPIQG